jgi:DNA-binding HxlR family transcriptional regulator
MAAAAKLLGDKWTLIVVRDLAHGSCRFKSLENSGEGISPSILTARLRELEDKGLISRRSFNEIPPRVEYTLTEKGRDVLPVIDALRTYGVRWCSSPSGHDAADVSSVRAASV